MIEPRALMIGIIGLTSLFLVGCGSLTTAPMTNSGKTSLNDGQVEMIVDAVARVETVAQSVCEQTLPGKDCKFSVAITDESDTSINAYQVRGQPLIVFTQPMMAIFKNEDEVAFVYSHEAAHYILEHGQRRQERELLGGLLLGGLAMTQGSTPSHQQNARDWARIGSHVGNRVYSVEEEFEADLLGASIAHAAGFNPSVGVLIFDQTPDSPSGQILPSHPGNSERIAAIQSRYP